MILFISLAAGFLLANIFPFTIYDLKGYDLVLYTLLGIGLYGAVYGIDLKEFHIHKMLIFRAITFGVLLKSLVIGSIFWIFFQSPYAFLFGVIVAQIDPLSVAHLIDNKTDKFSSSGRTILRAWSSFDDPMTVLLALYIFLPLSVTTYQANTLDNYFFQIGANLIFAFIFYCFTKLVMKNNLLLIGLLGLAFIIAIVFKLMLGIALVGLFLRPKMKLLPAFIQFSFVAAALLLGSLLTITATNFIYGAILGFVAFVSQAVATLCVAPKLSQIDKLFLSVAQYNGITAIILALIIATWIPETISIIAVGIVTINLLYYASNWMLERKLR